MVAESKSWAEHLQEILAHLRMAEKGCLLLVAVDDGELCDGLVAALKEHLDGQVDLREHRLDFAYPSLGAYLRTLPPPPGRAGILVYGLDDLPEEARERAFRYLNTEREVMRLAGHSIVLFLRTETVPELLRRSPDFCVWSSGLFEFRAPSDELVRERELAAFHLLLAGSDLEKLRQRYLEYLVNEHDWLDFRGILQLRTIVRLKLEDVYVPLWATTEPRREVLPLSELVRLRGELLREGIPAEEAVLRAEAWRLEAPLPERKVELKEALSENERVVVLGDPGSGKTMLLKCLTLCLAKGKGDRVGLENGMLPILLPISAYADALILRLRSGQAQGAELELVDFLPRYLAERGLPDLSPLFTEELERGRCLLLLDGLDEVIGEEMRLEVARRVRDLVGRYPGNRYVVTSRIAGYRPGLLSDNFAHFTILPFSDEEMEKFARQWCYAYERPVLTLSEGEGEGMGAAELTSEAERRAEERTKNLIAAITSKEAIKRLAANPLLVTILALIHYQGTRLPHRRVELYRLCVEALAETWNLARSLTRRPIDLWLGEQRLDERFVVQLLAPIAFWMHSERPGGLVGREELEERIAVYFQEREGRSPEEAGRLAHDFVELIREQSGLLVERGLDQFGFMHLTFEEYLAARYLAGRRDVNELVKGHLHDPRWREAILLTTGTLRGDFADDLVEAIWKANSPYDDILHRDLLMAARCLADDVDVSHDLRRRILEDLFAVWLTTRYEKLRQEMTESFVAMRGSVCEGEALVGLLAALRDEDSGVRRGAAEALGELGQVSDEVIGTLLAALRDEDASVRGSAAEALGKLGKVSDEMVGLLLTALRDEEWHVREGAVEALGKLGKATNEVVAELLAALRDRSLNVRRSATKALGELGKVSDEAVRGLLAALRDEEEYLRWRAAKSLGLTGKATDKVVRGLLVALRDESSNVRGSAAGALGQLGQDSDLVVGDLLAALWDESGFVREEAAVALGELGKASSEVVSELIIALGDVDLARRASLTLIQLGRDSEEIALRVLAYLRGKLAYSIVIGVVSVLGELGKSSDEVVEGLLAALRDKDGDVRWRAAWALGAIGKATDEVVEGLLAALRDESSFVRERAAWALGAIGKAADGVVEGLLAALRDESSVREEAAVALGKLGRASGQVVEVLVRSLRDPSPGTRGSAAAALGQLKADGQVTHELVRILGHSRNGWMVWVAGRHAPVYDFVFEALWELS